ncbi:putative ribonuclease H protein, partial [Trifolium medium]|nr:putative ribonuclease H protein [Trifolium medium]
KRISWVKWETICLPKREGGLGVRDLRIVNTSLLAKWRWRLLQNEDAMWVMVLCKKYGAAIVSSQWLEAENPNPRESLWWKDVRSVWGRGGSKLELVLSPLQFRGCPAAAIGDMGNWLGEDKAWLVADVVAEIKQLAWHWFLH